MQTPIAMNGGQKIAQVLKSHGIRHLFTLCGGHIAPIYVEAEKAGIRIWDVRDEANAIFAADATARLTGTPGIAAVTAGPGVTNTITALKNAQMAQSPVLLIGGATATLLRNRGALQDIDQVAIVQSSVKFHTRAKKVRDLAWATARGLHIAQNGIPGPVFVEFPVDLLYPEEIVREWYGRKNKKPAGVSDKLKQWYIDRKVESIFAGSNNSQPPAVKEPVIPKHSVRDVQAMVVALRRSKKPLLLIGSGSLQSPLLAAQIAEVVAKLGVPVYLSGMARGLMGRHHQLHFHHHRREALREADLILLAGVPCDFRLDYGRSLNRHANKIAVNRSRIELRKNLKANLTICADPGAFLVDLENSASALPLWEDWKKTLYARDTARDADMVKMAEQRVSGINPLALFLQLEQLLPENSILIADGGDFAATAAYTLHPRKPLSWLDPGVFGTLGVGGGFALGAAACCPNDYIWIIYGDGSSAYSLAEFETFAKNGLKVCGVVGNNGSWEQIARDQISLLGTDTAVRLPRTDYHRVAEGYGASGEKVDTLEGFAGAVRNAIASMDKNKPYLINAMIGSTAFREGSISI